MSDEATTSAAFIASAAATPLPPRPPASGGRVKLVKIYHQKDNTADQQPTVDDWSNSSPILLSDTEEVILPSNQLASKIKKEPEEEEEDNSDSEFEQLSFLTQYIGPPKPSKTDRPSRKEAQITKEVTSFMENYLELVGTLDRATGHKESLTRAVQRGRTPAKLRITIKPLVMNREEPKFTTAWDRAVRKCETTLVKVITDHLDNTVLNTN